MAEVVNEFQKALPDMLPALEVAFNAGLEVGTTRGLIAGEMIGYVRGLLDAKAGLSDGLRHGSPVCARLMQSMRNLGLNDDDGAAAMAE